MIISINNNISAANTLGSHCGRLLTSTERLSPSLRINSAADDAAGLAIREMWRTDYGAMQNRLENTITNLKFQAENLQASESRISDADIAQEMMNFVRNQILTQSAVAMLTQANSMPRMVMALIG